MKITKFEPVITVRGSLAPDEQRTLSSDGRPFVATEFELQFVAASGTWAVQFVDVLGWVIKKDGTPGRRQNAARYWLRGNDVPSWVHAIVRSCQPDGPAPRLRRSPGAQ